MDLESGAADKRKGIYDRNGKTKKVQVFQTLSSLVRSFLHLFCVKVFCFFRFDFLEADVESNQNICVNFQTQLE